jgi:hypothetical protein
MKHQLGKNRLLSYSDFLKYFVFIITSILGLSWYVSFYHLATFIFNLFEVLSPFFLPKCTANDINPILDSYLQLNLKWNKKIL